MMNRRLVLVEVSMQFLRDILKLPPEVKIVRVAQTWDDERRQVFKIVVESPSLKEVPEVQEVPYGMIEIRSEFCPDHEHSCIVGAGVK